MYSKVVVSSAVFVGVVNAAAIARRQELSSGPSSVSFPVPSSNVVPSSVSPPVPGPSGVPAGCPSVILPTNTNLNGTNTINGTVLGDNTNPNPTTNVNSTTDNNNGQGETWGEWGTNIGNYYSNLYNSPDDVPGLPQFKRKRSPETWGQWGSAIGNYYANLYGSPDDVPGLPQYKKRSPETWGEWGSAIGNYYANLYGSPDDVPGLPQYKRSPQPETWGEWGSAIGNYYANLYNSPDDVPGLPHYKREPEVWGDDWTGWHLPTPYGSPDDVSGFPQYKRSPQPETWGQWGSAIGNYYANLYGSPDDVPGLPQYKRQFDSAPISKRAPAPENALPHNRRDVLQAAGVISLIRIMQIDVQTKMIAEGRGDSVVGVVGQLEDLVAQANTAGSDLNGVLTQAQNIVNNA